MPIPVLAPEETEMLREISRSAMAAKANRDFEALNTVESDLDGFTRDLYGIPRSTDLWVVR